MTSLPLGNVITSPFKDLRISGQGGRRGKLEAGRAGDGFPVAGEARLAHRLLLLEELAWLLEQQDTLTGKLDGAGEGIKNLAATGSGLTQAGRRLPLRAPFCFRIDGTVGLSPRDVRPCNEAGPD